MLSCNGYGSGTAHLPCACTSHLSAAACPLRRSVSVSSKTGEFFGVSRTDNVVPMDAYTEVSSNGQCQATNPFEYIKTVEFTNTYEAR